MSPQAPDTRAVSELDQREIDDLVRVLTDEVIETHPRAAGVTRESVEASVRRSVEFARRMKRVGEVNEPKGTQ